jgi:hypothetical protein
MCVERGNLTNVKNSTAGVWYVIDCDIKARAGGKFLFSGDWHKGFINLALFEIFRCQP